MKKVKITVAQELGLKDFINVHEDLSKLEMFEIFISETEDGVAAYSIKPLKELNGINHNDFFLILNGWYEVEEPFQVGEWVYDSLSKNYAKIVNLHRHDKKFPVKTNFKTSYWIHPDYIEKVTEPWKILLLEEGREKPEFKIGDLYVDNQGENWRIDDEQFLEEYALPDFENGKIKLFFPIERGIEVKA